MKLTGYPVPNAKTLSNFQDFSENFYWNPHWNLKNKAGYLVNNNIKLAVFRLLVTDIEWNSPFSEWPILYMVTVLCIEGLGGSLESQLPTVPSSNNPIYTVGKVESGTL